MSRSRGPVLALSLALAAAGASPAAAAPQPVADAVALTDTSPHRSVEPQVVAVAGGFFSVWENLNSGIWGRAVAAHGESVAPQRLLVANTPLPSNPGEGWWVHNTDAALAPLPGGQFLMVWTRELTYIRAAVFMHTSSPLRRDVLAQRFAADGTPVGPQWRVDGDTGPLNEGPEVALLSPSRLLVVWRQEGQDGGLRGRLLTAAGTPLGEEIELAGAGASQPAVAANAAGDVLVAWTAADDDDAGVFARLFDRGMVPVGDAFAVNTTTAERQRMPQVDAGADGGFLVSWWSDVVGSGRTHAVAQLVTPAGALAGGERAIGDFWETTNLAPNVVALPGGGYLHAFAIWNRWYAIGIYAELLDAQGNPLDKPVRVSDIRPQGAHQIGLAAGDDGTVFVAWEGFNDPNHSGIRGRAVAPPAAETAP